MENILAIALALIGLTLGIIGLITSLHIGKIYKKRIAKLESLRL